MNDELSIIEQARAELREEMRREAILHEKERLRAQQNRSLWQRLIDKLPFNIKIERKIT